MDQSFGKHTFELRYPDPAAPVGVTLVLHLDIDALDELLVTLDGRGVFNGAWYAIRDAALGAVKQGAKLPRCDAAGIPLRY